jgi:hypothetical protein
VPGFFSLSDAENALLRGSLPTTHHCVLFRRSYFVKDKPKDKIKSLKHCNNIFSCGLEGIA